EAIADTGSLSQAAQRLGMSYRRAWLLIDSMNADFDTPVISATVGGSGGGGAQLTAFGRELAQAYRGLEGKVATLAAKTMGHIAAHVATPPRRAASGGTARQRLARPLR
ncbi:MAG TPA: LysR family transcriptional regulator, partial [Acetobacteraceae bacterium]|nr:LysR family transcriptional regulator [Acetobacteraceae bacterium]